MKLIIQSNRVAGTATDDYIGPEAYMDAPEGFDLNRLGDYRVVDGAVVIPPPQSVTMRQARLALLGAGLLSQVDAAIASMASPAKEAAQIEWEYAAEVQRNAGLVPQLGAALGLSDADLDNLFLTASTL